MKETPENSMSRLSLDGTAPIFEDLKSKIAELNLVIAAKDEKIATQKEDIAAQDKENSRLAGELEVANEVIDLNLSNIRILPSRVKDKLNKTFPPAMVDLSGLGKEAIQEQLITVKEKAVTEKERLKSDAEVRTWRYGALEDEWFAAQEKTKNLKLEAEKAMQEVDAGAVAKLEERQMSLEKTMKDMDTYFMCDSCWGVEGKSCDGSSVCNHYSSENKRCEWTRWISISEEGIRESE